MRLLLISLIVLKLEPVELDARYNLDSVSLVWALIFTAPHDAETAHTERFPEDILVNLNRSICRLSRWKLACASHGWLASPRHFYRTSRDTRTCWGGRNSRVGALWRVDTLLGRQLAHRWEADSIACCLAPLELIRRLEQTIECILERPSPLAHTALHYLIVVGRCSWLKCAESFCHFVLASWALGARLLLLGWLDHLLLHEAGEGQPTELPAFVGLAWCELQFAHGRHSVRYQVFGSYLGKRFIFSLLCLLGLLFYRLKVGRSADIKFLLSRRISSLSSCAGWVVMTCLRILQRRTIYWVLLLSLLRWLSTGSAIPSTPCWIVLIYSRYLKGDWFVIITGVDLALRNFSLTLLGRNFLRYLLE